MINTERGLICEPQIDAGQPSEFNINSSAITAYYKALELLGDLTPETTADARVNKPPIQAIRIAGGDNTVFSTVEGPDIAPILDSLRFLLTGSRKSPTSQVTKREIESVIGELEANSTVEGGVGFWNLGNRADVPGYRAHRIAFEAVTLARRKGLGTMPSNMLQEATEQLAGRRELILSSDDNFYHVAVSKNGKVEERRRGTEIAVYTGELETLNDGTIQRASGQGTDIRNRQNRTRSDDGVLEARYIHSDKRVRVQRSFRPNRRTAIAAAILALAGVTASEATNATNLWEKYKSRGAAHRVLDQSETPGVQSENITPTTIADIPPTTKVESSTTTLPTTTTTVTPEAKKPTDPVGVAWLSDTMNPWKEQIAKEAAVYGIDPAIPAIYAYIKTAGDYTFLTNDGNQSYGGLFALSDVVLKEGAKELGISNPILVDSTTNIRIGVRLVAQKYKAAGGSIRKTGIGLEGADGEVAKLLEDMMNDRDKNVSQAAAAYDRKYGYRIVNARAKLKEQGLL